MKNVNFSNLEKIFFPELGLTKGDLINYYLEVAPYLLPHLKDRPESLLRFPDGIYGNSFFQKDFPDSPEWIEKIRIVAESKVTNYLLCQKKFSLAYFINLGCIDLNPWLSRVGNLDRPDYAILDLDPLDAPFEQVAEAARVIKTICDRLGLKAFVKTSGQTGLHIFIPLGARYTYDQARNFAQIIATLAHRELPDSTSLERNPSQRVKKVYIDYLQNFAGQTIASVYSVRPNKDASVSTPLFWEELNGKIEPKDFNIKNIKKRLVKIGDIFYPALYKKNNIEAAIGKIGEYYSDLTKKPQ